MKRVTFTARVPYRKSTKPARPGACKSHFIATGGLTDTQSPRELKQREIEAKAAAWKQAKRLAEARPIIGEHCIQKACPFLAVLDGECRQHAMDRHREASAIPSQFALVKEAGQLFGYGGV